MHPDRGRPLTGLETLPASLIVNLVLTYLFIWLSGWHRDAHGVNIGGTRVPVPTRYTVLSGIGTALVLFTVPLSFTFTDVSIPFIQLLMRGDILVIAPLVDFMFGRRVRWYSWTALVIVAVALTFVVHQRGGFHLPPLAIATVVLYTVGYFLRLAVMTRISKSGDAGERARLFRRGKAHRAAACRWSRSRAVGFMGLGTQADELAWGFTRAWSDPVFLLLAGGGFTLTIISVFAAIILLNPRENSYCVPLERSSSLLADSPRPIVLHAFWNQPAPTGSELIGAVLLLGAIVLLTLAPRFARCSRGRADQALSRAISRKPTSITFCAMLARRWRAAAARPRPRGRCARRRHPPW